MNGRGGVKLATIIEQQGCEVRDDSQRVSSGDDVPEGGLGGYSLRRLSLSLIAEVTSFKWKTHRSDLAAHENERRKHRQKKWRRELGDGKGRETNSFRLRHRRRIDGRFPLHPPAPGRPVDRDRSPPNEQRVAAEAEVTIAIASEELGEGRGGNLPWPAEARRRSTLAGRVAGRPGVEGPFHP